MFEVNQQVWDIIMGPGVVVYIHEAHPYPVAVKFSDDGERNYTTDGKHLLSNKVPSLYPHPVEVVKAIKKPSINWEHVHSRYNYLAEDSCGAVFLYKEEPFIALNSWGIQGGEAMVAHMFASYVKGTCDWKDSLVKRPD